MKTSLLGNCAKGNLHLPNSLARAFLVFRKLAIILASINWQNNSNNKKEIYKTYACHENSTPLIGKQNCWKLRKLYCIPYNTFSSRNFIFYAQPTITNLTKMSKQSFSMSNWLYSWSSLAASSFNKKIKTGTTDTIRKKSMH